MLATSPPPPPANPPLQNGAAHPAPPLEPPQPVNAGTSASTNTNTDAISSKKTYLSLLPPAQIIEICLLFEPHVPLHVKSTVWPADLEAAISELKKNSQSHPTPHIPSPQPEPQDAPSTPALPNGDASGWNAVPPPAPLPADASSSNAGTPSHQVHPPGPSAPPTVDPDPPMGSLRDPAEEAREKEKANTSDSGATTIAAGSPVPQPNGGDPSASSAPPQPHAGPSQPQAGPSHASPVPPSHASTPQPQPQPQAQHANLHPPNPYPYAHYGYAVPQPQPQGQQTAYPHAPYYAPPPAYPAHYQYPYAPPPGYPAPPPAHSPPPPHPHSKHPQHPLFNSNPLVRPPIHPTAPAAQPPPPPPSEDLPSYEEMIVEALLDCGDAEGAAPKDLFTWMASRYPLQTNFRPSASQALQKAYKRGRLEKRAGGKYRLNPAWEGGATSKRTTRRPQTLAQTTYAMHHAPQQPSSPFTHAPLQQHPHPPAPGPQQPYNGYPYSYPYGHYPGYPQPQAANQSAQAKAASQPPPVAPASSAPAAAAATAGTKTAEEKDQSTEENNAWEAAQHILKAINFGGLELAPSASSSTDAANSSAQNGVSASASAPPVLADGDADLAALLSALVNSAGAAAPAERPRATLTEDERAALQAQLALLAAQLTEIAEGEEDEEPAALPPAPAPTSIHAALAQVPPPPAVHVPPPQPATAPQPPQAAPAPQVPPPMLAQPSPRPALELPPPPIAAYAGGSRLVLDINAFPEIFAPAAPSNPPTSAAASNPAPASNAPTELPALGSGHQTEVDELGDDDDSDDDDMEDVVVPLHPRPAQASPEGVRT